MCILQSTMQFSIILLTKKEIRIKKQIQSNFTKRTSYLNMITNICMKRWQTWHSTIQFFALNVTRKNNCIDKIHYNLLYSECFFVLRDKYYPFTDIPKVTNPAFADKASTGAPSSSRGGLEDHKQEGALWSPAVRLASTNS